MLASQDVAEDSLPDTFGGGAPMNGSVHPNAAQNFAQVGDDSMVKLLESSILEVKKTSTTTPGVILLDANAHLGNLCRAFIKCRGRSAIPLYYVGVAPDEKAMDWLESDVTEEAKTLFLDGNLKVAGEVPKPKTAPDEWQLGPIAKPNLNVLVMRSAPGSLDHLAVPEPLWKEWGQHADKQLRTEFEKAIAEYDDEFKFSFSLLESAKNPNKRKNGVLPDGTPTKVPKLEADGSPGSAGQAGSSAAKLEDTSDMEFVDVSSLEGALLGTCNLHSVKKTKAQLQLRNEGHVAIANLGKEGTILPEHMPVGMFGKGVFKQLGTDKATGENLDFNELTDIMFKLDTHRDLVIFENKVTDLKSVIDGIREKDPSQAKVAYHEIKELVEPGMAGGFSLVLKHRVVLRCSKNEAVDVGGNLEVQQSAIAGLVSPKVWHDSPHCLVLWCVKITKVKGVVPVAPRVVLRAGCTLPPNKALVLTA